MNKDKKKEKKVIDHLSDNVIIDIPEDEIWTYQVEGLPAPSIGQKPKNYLLKKIIFTVTIIIAVSLSIYFSFRAVKSDTFEFEALDSGNYQLYKFSNTGNITELDIGYVTEIKYEEGNNDPATNFYFESDETMVVTDIREFAFNCDEKLKEIRISASVTNIEPLAFYTCRSLERIIVDENNPNYCDIDGVLYNKDKTEVICYPMNHANYLREKYEYTEEIWPDNENYEKYKKEVLTYVVPSTVTTITELAFNYCQIADVYLPEGLTKIETLGFFKSDFLENIYSYKSDKDIETTDYTTDKALGTVYRSLPEGLEFIGSDCFSYCKKLGYMYIPSSVTSIGHHAFYDCVYKDNGELRGIDVMNVAADKETFKNVNCGDDWKPKYKHMLFKKGIEINYSAERAS